MAKKYHGNGKRMSKNIANPGFGGDFSNENAGLPAKEIIKEYPKANYGGPEGYVDDMNGLDMFAKNNNSQMMKGKKKY